MEGALSEHQVNTERQWTSYVTYKYGEGENILNSGHWGDKSIELGNEDEGCYITSY